MNPTLESVNQYLQMVGHPGQSGPYRTAGRDKPSLTPRGQELPTVQNPVFLGIKFDPQLTLTAHINDLKTKMSQHR